jgi:UDP-N-acetylmuramoylalanine--D-glutamate ligase
MDVQNKRVLVVGLARSGFSVAHALATHGAVVTVTDRKPPADFGDLLPQLLKDKVGLELGAQRVETFLRHQIIVISPGVPWDMPHLQAARERRIPVYPEVEAASWFLEGTLVGVTGSNGKTTTTSLLGDMLKASGFPTFVGGNIGDALSSAVDHAQPGTRFVTELSSFQLEGIHEFRPHVAVMLNLSPNHLDRHPSLEAYAEAKRRIFHNQNSQDYAVLNADDPWVAGLQAGVASQPVFFSRRRELANGVFISEGKVFYRVRHLERVLFETSDVTLRGDFNLEDVLAATTAACLLGADFAAIRKAVRAFQAVEHRLEFVREIEGVKFFNNSKATSVDATVKSLEAFESGLHVIMGGKDKGAPYAPLLPLLKGRVREILVIGAAAPVITEQLAGAVDIIQAGDIATAVYEAFTRSRPGDTVLLAPACSSFDQFNDYEERGRVFKGLVKRLAKDVSTGRVFRRQERGQESGARKQELGVRSQESGARNPESGVLNNGSEGRGLESGILNLESRTRRRPKGQNIEGPRDTVIPTPDKEVRTEGGMVDPTPTQTATDHPTPRATTPSADKPARKKPAKAPQPVMDQATAETTKVTEAAPPVVAPAENPVPPPGVEYPPVPAQTAAEERSKAVVSSPSAMLRIDFAKEPDGSQESAAGEVSGSSSPQVRAQNESTTSGSESSQMADTHEEKRAESPIPQFPSPMSHVPSPVSRTSTPSHHVELSYVYEVDAEDMPEVESQVLPEDEPVISVSASTAEVPDDEALPFESRKAGEGESEVPSPKSETQGAGPGAQPSPKDPRPVDGKDR